ncbi:putative porin [Roseivirga sp.]|uniref:putative porin n=1 Tax=Roseivirga sp. TaxID=1964215 RepID=UPI003B522430
MLKKVAFLAVLISLSFSLKAQNGLNSFNNGADSLLQARMNARDAEALASKGNYNAGSTRFTFEKNFKFNNIIFQNPDTLPDNMHRVSMYERNKYLIQNLGNVGTAQRSLFYEPSHVIGRTSGYTAYDAFYTTPDKIRYFDTRSPYTDIEALFAGGGRSISKVLFTFNDSTQFNIGGSFNAIRAEKQLAYLSRSDRHVNSNDWNIFGFVRPKNLRKYLLLFNLTQFSHTVSEQGGIIDPELQPNTPDASFFDYEDANVYLSNAESYDKRGGLHLFQQFDLDSIFQIYHTFDYREQLVRYNDLYDLNGFDQYLYSEVTPGETSGTIEEGTFFSELSNELGLKGRTKKFSYTAYYKNRMLTSEIFRDASSTKKTEHYVGGTLRQQITPKIFLSATGQFLFDGNYLVEGEFTSDVFEATYSRIVRQPSFLAQRYVGEQMSWTNDFGNETSDNLEGTIKVNYGRVSFRPFLRFNRISNYLYFDENQMPAQANSDVVLLTPGLHFDYQLTEKVKWSNTFRYNSISGGSADTYRLPEMMGLSQLAYRSVAFDGKMVVHTGIEAFFQTSYQPLGYNPIVQQFYLQNDFTNDDFVKVDLFLNFKVGNFLFLVKMGHANQPSGGGYFITPNYTGAKRSLDLGVRWLFFD